MKYKPILFNRVMKYVLCWAMNSLDCKEQRSRKRMIAAICRITPTQVLRMFREGDGGRASSKEMAVISFEPEMDEVYTRNSELEEPLRKVGVKVEHHKRVIKGREQDAISFQFRNPDFQRLDPALGAFIAL